jgi:sugar phosphate isomerase/epimerase
VCLHNEVGTQISGQDSLIRVLERTEAALCLDTGHLVAAGGDPLAILGAYWDRVRHVHLKDARPSPSGRTPTPAGSSWSRTCSRAPPRRTGRPARISRRTDDTCVTAAGKRRDDG